MDKNTCSVEGCDSPSRKRTWCASHYSQWRRKGEVRPFTYKWTPKGGDCLVCGQPCIEPNHRKVCSPKCQQLLCRNDGQAPPTTAQCQRCGDMFSLTETSPRSGRKRRSDAQMCGHCKRARHTRHKVSVSVLAQRDGTVCTLCGETVDMTLRAPDLFRASVDHVIPYSLGGSHDPSNLALAHLWCNQVKRNRTGWNLLDEEPVPL